MKITVERQKNMFGKPTGQFVVKIGNTGWEAAGATKDAALKALEEWLTQEREFSSVRRYVPKGKVMFVLYYCAGWAYDIVHSDGQKSTCLMTKERHQQKAFETMMRHVESYEDEY